MDHITILEIKMCNLCLKQSTTCTQFNEESILILREIFQDRFQFTGNVCYQCLQKLKQTSEFIEMIKKSQFELSINSIKQENSICLDISIPDVTIKEENHDNENTIEKITIYNKNSSKENDEKFSETDDEINIALSNLKEMESELKTDLSIPKTDEWIEKKVECKQCNKFFLERNYEAHIINMHKRSVVCHICGKVWRSGYKLQDHIRQTHSNRIKPKCDICGKTFQQKNRLNMHKARLHSNCSESSFVCDYCGKGFYAKAHLTKHVNNKHLKTQQFSCSVCKKQFSSKYAMTTHMRQHTNEMPFRCELCNDEFRHKVSLKMHKKSKHNIVEATSFNCKVCGKGFASEGALYTHERVHK